MNVSLTKELEALVSAKVETGMYTSASEVVREGLRLLEERDAMRNAERESLRQAVAEGMEDIKAGRVMSGEDARREGFEYIKRRKAEKVAERAAADARK